VRFLKRLLCALYLYLAVFAAACLLLWCVRGEEPSALIAAVFGAAGTESVVGAWIRLGELRAEREKERNKAQPCAGRNEERDDHGKAEIP